ncbi:MAG: trypsin-like peptidase domain-containing protein [Rhodoblastus sp.]
MRRLLVSILLALSFAAPPASATEWKYKDVADLVAATMPSFVNIYNRRLAKDTPSSDKNADTAAVVEDDVGSGVIVSPDGMIVTNRHVIEGAYALFVTLSDGRRLQAKLVLAGTNYDLALIKIDAGDKPLKAAALGDSEKMRLGDRVVAIGNPLGFAGSVSSGVISAFHRQVGLSAYDNLIQTDATINRGNSGGPLFNMNGEVIGINQAIYTQNQGGSIGIGFSIPIDDVKHAQEGIEKFGKPRLGWLGVSIQPVTEPMAFFLGLGHNNGGGAIVADVKPNSPAAAAGLKVGDVIRTFDGRALRDAIDLNRAVAHAADGKVELGVWREGKMTKIPVSIGQFPGNIWVTQMAPLPDFDRLEDFGGKFEANPKIDGVEMTAVADKSIAWYSGLRAGDIVRKVGKVAIHNVDDLKREMLALKKADIPGAVIFVDGPNGPRWLSVDMLQ